MGAREDLLAAAKSLSERGIEVFSPGQLIGEARSLGSSYPDSTLRTLVVGPMCLNSPDNHAVQYGDLERVARAVYRLVGSTATQTARESPGPEALVDAALPPEPSSHDEEWFWEGNVQALVVSHLAAAGWRIRRVANTASSEHGVDIEADREGVKLLVEVKGYPGTKYARGVRKGETKATPAAAQARMYFSNALLSGLLMRAGAPDARVVLAFPSAATFTNLAERVVAPLGDTGIEIWLVAEDGSVGEVRPG